MDRRRFIAGSAAVLSLAGQGGSPAFAAEPPSPGGTPFGAQMVRQMARQLAQHPFKDIDRSLPKTLKNIDYDAYRSIRFRPEQALWRGDNLPFQVQFFHRGFIYLDRVEIYVVDQGRAREVVYSPGLFDFGNVKPPEENEKVDFAGFRLHAAINRPDYFDEVGVFLGASYFRAVAKGQVYGLSARGLSIRTADPKGEEFPAFRKFWIEKPRKNTNSIVVHALLDSKSASGAFRFTIRPGEATIYDVELALYPRVNISELGIGSLTSMFFFDANDRVGVDDFRSAVHDSDGLGIRNGHGEQIWRPLSNPHDLQVSEFADVNPRGFGLFQRERSFFAYDDLESNFEKRPSAWVEPIGDWGEGAVHLVEIPTKEEIHDNIVASWRPREPLQSGSEHNFIYRVHWGFGYPKPWPLAEFAKTRIGAGPDGSRRFIIEAVGSGAARGAADAVRASVNASAGKIRNLVIQPNPQTGGARISFELMTNDEKLIELRAQLMKGEDPVSEVWIYRWTP